MISSRKILMKAIAIIAVSLEVFRVGAKTADGTGKMTFDDRGCPEEPPRALVPRNATRLLCIGVKAPRHSRACCACSFLFLFNKKLCLICGLHHQAHHTGTMSYMSAVKAMVRLSPLRKPGHEFSWVSFFLVIAAIVRVHLTCHAW